MSSSSINQFNQFIYLLGSKTLNGESFQIAGRINSNDLINLRLDKIEQLTNSKNVPWETVYFLMEDSKNFSPFQFQNRSTETFKIFSPSVAESSLHFDDNLKKWMIVSLDAFKSSITFCFSHSIDSRIPWNCSVVYEVDKSLRDQKDIITYAGKAHPDLVNPSFNGSGMVLSFVSNSLLGGSNLYEEGRVSIYSPKFIFASPIV
jgi:hypothetical protein